MPMDPLASDHRIISSHPEIRPWNKSYALSQGPFETCPENALKSGEKGEADQSTFPLDVFRIL
jgi:hypothetical protein